MRFNQQKKSLESIYGEQSTNLKGDMYAESVGVVLHSRKSFFDTEQMGGSWDVADSSDVLM